MLPDPVCPYIACYDSQRPPHLSEATATLAGAFSVNSLFRQAHAADFDAAARAVRDLAPAEAAQNEDYWSVIQRALLGESGHYQPEQRRACRPSPIVVQQAVERYNQLSNEGPSYYMWQILDQGREPLREKLAALAGAKPGEIAIDRNSTEALNTIIYGLPLKAGDEVIGTKQDYPHMIQAYRQRGRARRDRLQADQLRLSHRRRRRRLCRLTSRRLRRGRS